MNPPPHEREDLHDIDHVWREVATQCDLPVESLSRGKGPRALCLEYILWLGVPALLVLIFFAVMVLLVAFSGSGDEVRPFVYNP